MAERYFTTELGVLQQLTRSLRDAEELMDSALRAMGDTSSGRVGTPDLDRACADFRSTWAYGLRQLRAGSRELLDGLDATTENYRQVEDALEREFAGLRLPASGEGGA